MEIRSKNLWLLHLLGWALFLTLTLTIVSRSPQFEFPSIFFVSGRFWLFVLIYVFIFYFNLLYLLPGFFLKQKYILYAAIFVTGLATVYFSKPFENLIFQSFQQEEMRGRPAEMRTAPPPENFERQPPPPRDVPDSGTRVDFVSLVLFLVVWIVGMSVSLSEQWRISERRAARSEADKAQAELSFFKAQINPHFLFNTLNNIYALAVTRHEHTADSILKLSRLMRYITEEATENFVPLQAEIACLEDYIDLQKLRLNAKTKVDFQVSGETEQVRIAPLILMTFVENAFKYGVSGHFVSEIKIAVQSSATEILFLCENRIFNQEAEKDRIGVGIANTRKRLDYMYAAHYDLKIGPEGDQFIVRLKLDLV